MKVKQVVVTALILGLLVVCAATTRAQTPPRSIPIGGHSETGEKPESKLWYTTDGTWWGILGYVGDSTASAGIYFYKLEQDGLVRQTFPDAQVVDATITTALARADVLWNGTHLFVLMYEGKNDDSKKTVVASLFKYTYDASNQTYTRLAGFPVNITLAKGSESATIAQDSTGRLWIVYDPYVSSGVKICQWEQPPIVKASKQVPDAEVRVLWLDPPHTTWNALNQTVLQTPICGDDIAAVVAFNGHIGVMWSDQTGTLAGPDTRDNFGFRVHDDSADPTNWEPVEVLPFPTSRLISDDHIHLTVTDHGDVIASTKSGTTDDGDPVNGTALNELNLFVRRHDGDPADPWDGPYFVTGNASRPIVVFDKAYQDVYVFYTGAFDTAHRNISYKVAKLSQLVDLAIGPANVFIEVPLPALGCNPDQEPPDAFSSDYCPQYNVNNATSTKQAVDITKGLLVVAQDEIDPTEILDGETRDASLLITAYYRLRQVVETRIAASTDDAHEKSGSKMPDVTATDVDLGQRPDGLRFRLPVPQEATIKRAYVQFTSEAASTAPTTLLIEGEASDNAQPFQHVKHNITNRPRTFDAVSWSVPSWTKSGQAGPDQQTPDLSPVIQEIVDRQGWDSGNGLVLIVTGSGNRQAWTYDGKRALAPRLHVEYEQ